MSVRRALRKGFALRSKRGLEYALVQDATGKTAREIHEMGNLDRELSALTRVRFWKWWGENMFGDDSGGQGL